MTRKNIYRRSFLKKCGLMFSSFFFYKFLYGNVLIYNHPKNMNFKPSYLKLYEKGQLKKIGEELWDIMRSCTLCPRSCQVNRVKGEIGRCGAANKLMISSYHPHFGEERPLVGKNGSGTIFFTHCSLRCVFCINWEISHKGIGKECTIGELAQMMLTLQKWGCHNLNLVTPTHYLPYIIFALNVAIPKGLNLPIVYNTHGYEHLEIIKKLKDVVDIYMPDFKYFDNKNSGKYSAGAFDYPEKVRNAILEMHSQVGVAKPDKDGLLRRGLIIRHLVMPNNVAGSKDIIKWIYENLPEDTYVNIMSQYQPVFRAKEFPEISRSITKNEYYEVVNYALNLGLTNLDIQGY